MIRTNKLMCKLILISLLAYVAMPEAQAETVPSLIVYAGPQSVSPRETIHVTVEYTNIDGSNMNEGNVELFYVSDGTLKTLSGTPKLGLISFDVSAQDMVGLMAFSAKAAGVVSKEAPVTVVAGPSQSFKITAQPSKKIETLVLTSNVITDSYGNPISDLSLVSIEWIDFNGLTARQNIQLLNGRIVLTAKCPAIFTSPLIIRASVNTIEAVSKDVSADCLEGEART